MEKSVVYLAVTFGARMVKAQVGLDSLVQLALCLCGAATDERAFLPKLACDALSCIAAEMQLCNAIYEFLKRILRENGTLNPKP